MLLVAPTVTALLPCTQVVFGCCTGAHDGPDGESQVGAESEKFTEPAPDGAGGGEPWSVPTEEVAVAVATVALAVAVGCTVGVTLTVGETLAEADAEGVVPVCADALAVPATAVCAVAVCCACNCCACALSRPGAAMKPTTRSTTANTAISSAAGPPRRLAFPAPCGAPCGATGHAAPRDRRARALPDGPAGARVAAALVAATAPGAPYPGEAS